MKGSTLILTVTEANLIYEGGDCDPYCEIKLGNEKKETKSVSQTKQPKWNQTFEFGVTTAQDMDIEFMVSDKDVF